MSMRLSRMMRSSPWQVHRPLEIGDRVAERHEPRPVVVGDDQAKPVLDRDDDLHHRQRVDAEVVAEARLRRDVLRFYACYPSEHVRQGDEHVVRSHRPPPVMVGCYEATIGVAPAARSASCTSYSWIQPKSSGTRATFSLRARTAGPSRRWSRPFVTHELRWIFRVRPRRRIWNRDSAGSRSSAFASASNPASAKA